MLQGRDITAFTGVDTGVLTANAAIGTPFGIDHALHAALQIVVTTITGTTPSVTPKLQVSVDGTNWTDYPLAGYLGGADWAAFTVAGAQLKLLQNLPAGYYRLIAGAVSGTNPRLNSVALLTHQREDGR